MPLVPFPAPLPITDGAQVAVWKDAAGLHVADDATPLVAARSLRQSDCAPAAVSRGRLALDCGNGALRLRDLVTDAETVPPGADGIAGDLTANFTANNGYLFTVTGLGSRLVGIHFSGKGGLLDLRYDLATGARVGPFFLRANQVPSLDAASGATALCAPLRVTTHRARETYTGSIFREQDAYAFADARLLLRHGGEMRLFRCGSRGFRVLGRSTQVQPVLTRRYAAWATRGTVFVRGLRTGTTRTFRVRRVAGSPVTIPTLAGTERRLWIGDAEGVRVLDL